MFANLRLSFMEDFIKENWPVAVVFIAMIISSARSVVKNKNTVPQSPSPEVLSEEFPTVEPQETQQPVEVVAKTVSPARKPLSVNKTEQKPVVNLAQPVTEAPAEKVAPKITIKGKSEAKKAFLYSEIFNRKY